MLEAWPATGAERLAIWNRELFEELFPLQAKPFTPVLLACDDETLRAVAGRLGLDRERASKQFAADVKVAFEVGFQTGFRWALRGGFEDRPRPRELPRFFGLLCLWVLAASLMGADEKYSTKEYYGRLNGLLEVRGDDQLESFPFIRPAFERFAEWLEDDLQGTRGRLLLREHPHPQWVGYAVEQTVFRRRDRDVLSLFFSERLRGRVEGLDPLPRLQRWSGRVRLTDHAKKVLVDPEMADRVRAAIRAAYKSWDGSELITTSAGTRGHVWPGGLRVRLGPPRLFLFAGNRLPIAFDLYDASFVLDEDTEVELPWAVLERIQEHPLSLGDPASLSGAVTLRALDGTALFELGEMGLQLVREPTKDEVWVLTCGSALKMRLGRWHVRDRGELPSGWSLFRDVPLEELPQVERAAVSREQEQIRFVGGLQLEPHVYLTGGPPVLIAGDLEIDGGMPVAVNDAHVAFLTSDGRVPLPDGPAGSYEVVVGDNEWWGDYELIAHGARSGYGSLAYRVDGPECLRAGATPDPPTDALTVCGACLSAPFDSRLPIFARGSQAYTAIQSDGKQVQHTRPPHPVWLAKVGLSSGSRWEIDPDGVAWLICRSRLGTATAQAINPDGLVTLDADAAELVERLAPAVSVSPADLAAWERLLQLARSVPR